MKLAIDAMSGDLGSKIVVEACQLFLKEYQDTTLVVCGKEEELSEIASLENVEIVDARDIITMNDSVMTIRRKTESSMSKAVNLCKNGLADGVVSCGSTGAFYACATFFLKRLEGVEKCALLATLPTMNGKGVCMLDVGANSENTPEQLESFAIMGHCYVAGTKGIANPTSALLNIGTEVKKGDHLHQETYQLLSNNPTLNFVGNIEGRDILNGEVDLIVTDGFSGNIALKTTEGVGMAIMSMLKAKLKASKKAMLGALLAKDALNELKGTLDYKSVGGAFMAGFEKPVVKAHGASDGVAFYNAMKLARQMVKNDTIARMKEGLTRHEAD